MSDTSLVIVTDPSWVETMVLFLLGLNYMSNIFCNCTLQNLVQPCDGCHQTAQEGSDQ